MAEMQRLMLQPRLAAIAALVPSGARLADVGTDHGYLPVALLQERRLTAAVATDIASGPLDHARRTAETFGVDLDCRLCDGLDAVISDETDIVVIAGMGGETIAHILGSAPWTREGTLLLLQPMSRVEVLRPWLVDHGYEIRGERLVEDKGILYPILIAGGGHPPPLTAAEIWAGLGREDPLYPVYAAQRMDRLRRAAEGLRKSRKEEDRQRLTQWEEALRQLEEQEAAP